MYLSHLLSFLIPLELTAATVSEADAAIQKNIFGSRMTTLIISNEEKNDIMKIVKSIEESSLMKKGVKKQIKMEQISKENDFLVSY